MMDSELDNICDRFDASWQDGKPLSIKELLTGVERDSRKELFQALLEIEFEYRLQRGETPKFEDYQEQFPKQQRLVAAALVSAKRRIDALSRISEPEGVPAKVAGSEESEEVRRVIGPYKLLQQIGEGGMGTVYMAEQVEPVRRRVALKLVKSGLDRKEVLSRFEAERQALAMMDHPHIAKVLDAGSTDDGLPFFVMELVNGIPITEFCDKYKLSLNDRLQLFVQACRAIQHAHQKGIIHRDVKPNNVLVTQQDGTPVVKVIDFGLAKALQNTQRLTDKTMFTEFGQVVGTLQYMSPEQSEMNALDIDTRSDVYSLGVLFYELLTGTTPIEKEALRQMALDRQLVAIREEEAPRPSSRLSSLGDSATTISAQRQTDQKKLNNLLRGELDWIALRALEKDRKRRYETANELASDVDRFLEGEPITARPPSFVYQIRKLVDRNRSTVTVAASILALLIIATVVAATGWLKATSYAAELELKTGELEDAVANEKTATDDARKARGKAEQEAVKAREEEQKAITAKEELEAKQSIETYLLARKRIEDGEVLDGMLLLDSIPEKQRSVEWYLLRQRVPVPERTLYRDPKYDEPTGLGSHLSIEGEDVKLIEFKFERTVRQNRSQYDLIAEKQIWSKSGTTETTTEKVPLKAFPLPAYTHLSKSGRIALARTKYEVYIFDVRNMKLLAQFKPTVSSPSSQGQNSVRDACFTKKENQVLICTPRGFELWDFASKEPIRSVRVDGIRCAKITDEVGTVVVGKENGQIVLFRPAESIPSATAFGSSTVSRLETLEGDELATHFSDGSISIYDSSDLRLKDQLDLAGENAKTMNADALGKYLTVLSSGNRELMIFDAKSRSLKSKLPPHWSGIQAYAFDDASSTIATFGSDNSIRTWKYSNFNVHTEKLITDTNSIVDAAFDSGESKLATLSYDGNLHVYDAANGRLLKEVDLGESGGVGCAFHPKDSNVLAVTFGVGDVRLVNIQSATEMRSLGIPQVEVAAFCFSPNGEYLLSVSRPTKNAKSKAGDRFFRKADVRVFKTETGELAKSFDARWVVTSVAMCPDGKKFATVGVDGKVLQRDFENGELIWESRGQAGLTDVAFSRNGELLVSGDTAGVVQLLSSSDGNLVTRVRTQKPLISVAFCDQDRRIVTHDIDGLVSVWDANLSHRLFMTPQPQAVTAITTSLDAPLIAGALRAENLPILPTFRTSQSEQRLAGHRDRIISVTLSNDNRYILSADESGSLILWNTKLAKSIWHVSSSMTIKNIAFSKDNASVYAFGSLREVRAWHTKSGEEFTPSFIPLNWINKRRISDGGRSVTPIEHVLVLASPDAQASHSFEDYTVEFSSVVNKEGDLIEPQELAARHLPDVTKTPMADEYVISANIATVEPRTETRSRAGRRLEPNWTNPDIGFRLVDLEFHYDLTFSLNITKNYTILSSSVPSFKIEPQRPVNKIRIDYTYQGKKLTRWAYEIVSVEDACAPPAPPPVTTKKKDR